MGTGSTAGSIRILRWPPSNTAMPSPCATASASAGRAWIGSRWWKAENIVRKPGNQMGTWVASAGLA